uniref:probable pectinesterase 56 n=1 Tax=Fragaria vesca subsp. vesca TaxID=101020 RepID=UPI0005C803E5|nr:PREDICTED: probable pectinesterase 56 [Fragaria vesca subsp. vesca]
MKMKMNDALVMLVLMLLSLTHSASNEVVVAQDGLGDFASIMDAVDTLPEDSPDRFIIRIKAGVYDEIVTVGKKKLNVVFIGDGVDSTVVTGNRSNVGGVRTFESATLVIEGDGFLATGITFENRAGPKAEQAVAVRINSYRTAFYRCRIASFQDTLYTQDGVQFFRECEIYGTVDFIFGHARVVLQNCYIYGRLPTLGQTITITAQNRDPTCLSGIVIHNCAISATKELSESVFPVKVYLGRP